MNVRFLTGEGEAAARWHEAAPLLAPVVDKAAKGEFTLDDIRELCAARCMHLAIFEKDGQPTMAMAFEFRHYPQFLAINIVALGGACLDEFMGEFFDKFKQWAQQAGASCIEASCSEAMARLLAKHGFIDTYRQVRVPV